MVRGSVKATFGALLFPKMEGEIDMKVNPNNRDLNTTLGDLIATISEVAFENATDAKEAYTLASLVLMEMLKCASFNSEIIDHYVPMSKYLH
jgi:hypothetical protein